VSPTRVPGAAGPRGWPFIFPSPPLREICAPFLMKPAGGVGQATPHPSVTRPTGPTRWRPWPGPVGMYGFACLQAPASERVAPRASPAAGSFPSVYAATGAAVSRLFCGARGGGVPDRGVRTGLHPLPDRCPGRTGRLGRRLGNAVRPARLAVVYSGPPRTGPPGAFQFPTGPAMCDRVERLSVARVPGLIERGSDLLAVPPAAPPGRP